MKIRSFHTTPDEAADDVAKLQQEKETLSQQVKQLIKAESKLYEYQEKLDAQFKEYKDLYDLNRKLSTTFDIKEIFQHTFDYIIYNLKYERVILLQPSDRGLAFTSSAFDGYYGETERRHIGRLLIQQTDTIISPLLEGTEYVVCKSGSAKKILVNYRRKFIMDEYLIYPLGPRAQPLALLIAGNSAENASFYRTVTDDKESLLGMGNLVGLLSTVLENHTYYTNIERSLNHIRHAEEAVRLLNDELAKKNDELARVNNRMINFFNTVSDGAMIVDRRNVVIELNPAAKVMLGKKAHAALGVPFGKLIDRRASMQQRLLPTRHSFSDVEIMMDSGNSGCHCLVSGEPILNEHGEVTGGLIIMRPIQQVQNLVHRFSGYFATLQFSDIIGESEGILEAVRLAKLTAATTSNVLLEGESGTGKEIFAQAIHNLSGQCNGPFIALNCGAIPRELIASELFGYEEGAFTGAKRGGKPGKFELAAGGTLFLDEIGDMPLEQQSSLLRVIQEKRVSRIGSNKMTAVSVRLICASNRNLAQEVERSAFRRDLFYRLNVMSITIPPLRERRLDIPLLFTHFLEKLERDRKCKFQVNLDVFDYLAEHDWPGNVRELQNVVERAASLAENGVISIRQLPMELYSPRSYTPKPMSLPESLRNETREQRKNAIRKMEKNRIIELLNLHGGNVSKVAREMEISRKTLYNKMYLYNIQN